MRRHGRSTSMGGNRPNAKKETLVSKLRIPLAAAAAAALMALAASSAVAGSAKIVAFKASFAGNATVKVAGTRVDISARATGTGTPIGKAKLTGTGVGTKSSDPSANCVPFSGPATIVTSTGLRLKFTVQPSSSGCAGEDQQTVTLSGSAKFAGGTGKFKTASGTFTFSGYYARNTGAFTVKFAGSLRTR